MKIYRWASHTLMPDGKKRDYYIIFTISFLVLTFFCFSWFIFSGKSLIWFVSDGWTQHFKSLVYYAQYLRKIARHLLFEHKLIIPDWDFYIGEGGDIINAMHYYVIGDPIALLSIFVPTRYMHIFFSFSCILRLYLSGIAFSALCFGTGIKNKKGVLTGALSYSLCYWGVFTAARHPYFLNPMIYFPLMILGIEKIIKKEKPYLFIATAAISAASNFYFFYMIVILAVGYALIRLLLLYKTDIKQGMLKLGYMGIMAVIGVCIAGIILLPVIMMFLSDSRMSVSQPFHLFYPLSYYSQLPSVFITNKNPYYLCLGFGAPAVLSIFLLFMEKGKDKLLKILVIVCIVISLFPIGGRILNGMSYMSNRWCWAFVLLGIYIMAYKWDDLLATSAKEKKLLIFLSIVYYAIILFFDKSRSAEAFSVIPLFFITLLLIGQDKIARNQIPHRQALLLAVVAVSIINISFWKFSPGASNYVADFRENSKLWAEEWENNETGIVKAFAKDSYPRYSGKSITDNANMVNQISNTGYYFSISIPSVSDYRQDLNMREDLFQAYRGYDDRTTPITLAGVGYYVTKSRDNKGLPYGYEFLGSGNAKSVLQEQYKEKLKNELGISELTKEQERKVNNKVNNVYDVYKNRYALPIGYCYSSYITEDIWNILDPVQKQQILLETAIIDSSIDDVDKWSGEISDYTIDYEIKCQNAEITTTDLGFVSTANNTKVTFGFPEEIKESEIYVRLEGIKFTPTQEYDLYFGDDSVDPLNLYNKTNWDLLLRNDQINIRKNKLYWNPVQDAVFTIESSNGLKKTINYRQPDSNFSSGRDDFIANLGYTDDAISSVTITFPTRGIYSFDSIKIYSIPMNGYAEKVANLQKDTLQNISFGIDTVKGNIEVADEKILCVATPYSKGWKVFVDETEQDVLCVNKHYIGVMVPKGYHDISFKYSMPYKHAGFAVSLFGLLSCLGVIVFIERKDRKRKNLS